MKVNDLSQIAEKVIKSGGVEPKFIGFTHDKVSIDRVSVVINETEILKCILQENDIIILR